MATLGPQIVSQSYGNLLKFLPTGEAGVTTNQVQITDGKGKVTPLHLATGSVLVDSEFTASAEVVFSGLISNAPGQYVSFDTTTGRLYYNATSSIVPTNALNATSASYAVTSSYAVSASFAPDDGDWIIGSTFMTASGQENVYIPGRLEQGEQTQAIGLQSHAQGVETVAQGNRSHAEGKGTLASGSVSHAEGHYTTASGFFAHSEGDKTLASNTGAHSEGQYTTASGAYSHAEGEKTQAVGDHSHAEGTLSVAQGNRSHAEGKGTLAFGDVSHAEGHYTTASGFFAHSEGDKTLAQNTGAHTGGQHTTSSRDYQTVVGQYNVGNNPNGNDTFVVGTGGDNNTREDAFKVRANTHEVIIAQETGPLQSLGQTRGLYFGEPTNMNSTRIMSSNTGFSAAMIIEWYSGNTWFPLMVAQSTATFTTT
jgi:hypothetical protein